MRDQLLQILKEVRPDIDFDKETKLITDEVLDSYDIVYLLSLLEEKLHIFIDIDEVTESNFDSIDGIFTYIQNNRRG